MQPLSVVCSAPRKDCENFDFREIPGRPMNPRPNADLDLIIRATLARSRPKELLRVLYLA